MEQLLIEHNSEILNESIEWNKLETTYLMERVKIFLNEAGDGEKSNDNFINNAKEWFKRIYHRIKILWEEKIKPRFLEMFDKFETLLNNLKKKQSNGEVKNEGVKTGRTIVDLNKLHNIISSTNFSKADSIHMCSNKIDHLEPTEAKNLPYVIKVGKIGKAILNDLNAIKNNLEKECKLGMTYLTPGEVNIAKMKVMAMSTLISKVTKILGSTISNVFKYIRG